jgi:hypothetical protein
MSVQLQIEETPNYLIARFIGAGTAKEVWLQYELIAESCERAHKNKLLLDFREAYGELFLEDRFFIGEKAQIFARYMVIKIAVVDRPERIDYEWFAEKVARNRGVNYRGFKNVTDAEEWLLK